MGELVDRVAGRITDASPIDLSAAFEPRGVVVSVGDGVARVAGLGAVAYEELVRFDGGAAGMAYDLDADVSGVILLDRSDTLRAGEGATRTGRLPSIPVGEELLGRAVDPVGRPLDDQPAPSGTWRPVFREAPALRDRASVDRPLVTGVMAIDAAVPIGRGQRQLIVGDRNVGKTALAMDIVAAQRGTGVICVYVVIGQPLSRILGIREALARSGALEHTVLVAADAAAAPGVQYLAPYAGAAVAERFRERGADTVVIYDDLTKHADVYRQLALLLRRPPGREAFPGDIFYVHAELLERATAFAEGGSVTAFPIVETTDGDISGYIPTNLISITDGQLYLDAGRFERNQRPAIDVGRSVSRIGGAAQVDVMREVARNLRIELARSEALDALTRVGLDIDAATVETIERGRILRALLKQPRLSPRSVADQVVALTAAAQGWLDGMAPAAAAELAWRVAASAAVEMPEAVGAIDRGVVPESGWIERLGERFARERPREAREATDEA